MSKFLVLGTGQQGSQIAKLLAANNFLSSEHKVVVAGIDRQAGKKIVEDWGNSSDLSYLYFDVKEICGDLRHQIGTWFKTFDVVVGAVPSHFGEICVELAAEYGVNYVDLSFTNSNLTKFDSLARANKCTIIPDCGLAPGLPNIIIGKLLSELDPGEKLDDLRIYVGGVAEKPEDDYVVTWSVEDLYEEYTRMARYVKDGIEYSESPLSLNRLEPITVQGTELEAFTSDGLRSLLSLKRTIPNMVEKTLRYKGHMENVNKLLNGGTVSKEKFVELVNTYYNTQANDVVFLVIQHGNREYSLKLTGKRDMEPNRSAMAMSTAGTCAAVALCLDNSLHYERTTDEFEKQARRNVLPKGVVMPEIYFANAPRNKEFFDKLKKITGIKLEEITKKKADVKNVGIQRTNINL